MKKVCSLVVDGLIWKMVRASSQPVAAVLGRHGRDLAEDLQAGAEIVALEGGIRIALERR